MIYIIEGCDAVGKTTLIKYMSKKLGYRVVKGSSFEQSDTNQDTLYSNFFELGLENNVIFDRYIWSNLVYGELYKDYAVIDREQIENIEELVRNKVRIIYLYASPNFLKRRIEQRGDDYVDHSAVHSILDKYKEVLSESTLPIRKINVEGKTTKEIFDEAFIN